MLVRRQEREHAMTTAQQELEQRRSIRVAERAQRMSNLDTAIDQAIAKFADISIALEYDATSLTEKYGVGANTNDGERSKRVSPCLGPRAHWMDCTKKVRTE